MKRVLVIGATGMLGQPVAQQLQKDGFQVRILSRNIQRSQSIFGDNFEFVEGDVERPATIAKALENCDGVHINLKAGPTPESYDQVEHKGTATVARLAKELGVERLTYLSGATTSKENTWFYVAKAKYDAENAIRESGVGYTIFRASWFMETLNLFVRGNRALKFGKQPSPVHWIAAADYAEMVSKAYKITASENKTLYVYGLEKISLLDALKTYCTIVRPDVKVITMPIWMMKMMAVFSRNAELKDVTNLMAYYENITEEADPSETYQILGTPTTTLPEWCRTQKYGADEQ